METRTLYRILVCFTMVLLPDSPAPAPDVCKFGILREGVGRAGNACQTDKVDMIQVLMEGDNVRRP